MPESLAFATRVLLTELGPSSRENISTIVCKVSEWLKCEAAAYACIENPTGDLRFRAVHSLPARPSTRREFARKICSEIISANIKGPVCEVSFTKNRKLPSGCDFPGARFKSFLGHPVTVDGRDIGAVVALNTGSRKFNAQDRGLIALLAATLAVEEKRYQREEALSRRIALEKMLKDLSTKAIASEDTSAFIEHSLAMLGSRMNVGGSFLWEFDPRKKTRSNTHEWLAEGHGPRKPDLQNTPVDSLPWAVSRLMKGDILKIDDVRSIPAKAEWELLARIGVRACLVIPLFSKDTFYGFIGLECYKGPKFWVSEDILVLQTAAEIMMRCIENRFLTEELRATQRNLEKTVDKKTHALRNVNRRLSTEISAHKKTISDLKHRETELADKNKTLMGLTNALAGLLNKNQEDLAEAQECVILNLSKLIDPAATGSTAMAPRNSQEEYIDKLRAGIEELSSLLKTKSSFVYQCLTPMEIQLANLIKQGKGNNQIADLMNLSRRTVKVHRYNIRKKLQLDKKRVNLNTYLLTME